MRNRLTVHRSNKSIYAQIIAENGIILVAASEKDLKKPIKATKTERAALVGEILAKKAIVKKIRLVFFDRKNYRYHGRVEALAQAARKGGLEF